MKKKTIKELKGIKSIDSLKRYIKKQENIREFKKEVIKQKELTEKVLKATDNAFIAIAELYRCAGAIGIAAKKLSDSRPTPCHPKGCEIIGEKDTELILKSHTFETLEDAKRKFYKKHISR